MSVISRNPFDLLGEDGSEAPAVKAPAQPKKAEAPKPAREVPGSKAPQQASRGRGGYYSRGAPRNVLKTSAEKTDAVEATDPESGFEGERRAPGRNAPRAGGEGRGEGRGRGRATRAPRGRGAAAGAGGVPHERRQDGRKSAHALPDTEKRVASGWGPEEGNAELAAEVEGAVDASKEAAAPDAEATAAATEAPAAEKKVEEEEDNTKSYEEYLAEKAKAAASFAQLEGRQVEGSSDFVGSALKKSDEPEDPFFSGLKQKEKPTGQKKETSSKKEKIFIEHEGRFAPPSTGERRGGARGGRGGNRGDRGERPARGTARGGRGGNTQRQAPIAVNDDKAFPALGA
ncbi:hypothetical protein QFC19_002674 [Naganishia cerealis]|uniref:Uncharacterized protein n=1 Tax=Naganishia cerealis TaxID=610337 RepID=A0ACC2W938_9TREE|nr:hypothetical protein QFC19_002674 [Naganishia cerealis]